MGGDNRWLRQYLRTGLRNKIEGNRVQRLVHPRVNAFGRVCAVGHRFLIRIGKTCMEATLRSATMCTNLRGSEERLHSCGYTTGSHKDGASDLAAQGAAGLWCDGVFDRPAPRDDETGVQPVFDPTEH